MKSKKLKNIRIVWERDKLCHFDRKVSGYDKFRPKYPIDPFKDIVEYSKLHKGNRALEIGGGYW